MIFLGIAAVVYVAVVPFVGSTGQFGLSAHVCGAEAIFFDNEQVLGPSGHRALIALCGLRVAGSPKTYPLGHAQSC